MVHQNRDGSRRSGSRPTRLLASLTRALIMAGLLLALGVPGGAADSDVIRMSILPGLGTLPLLVAADKGYFTEQHLDVQIKKFTASISTLVPSLARGDIDVAPVSLSPGYFNQYYEGFGVKAIIPVDTPHAGWNDSLWFMVRQDLWDAKTIRSLADLRGKTLDKSAPGTPLFLTTTELFLKAGLTPNDMTLVSRLRVPWISIRSSRIRPSTP